MKRGLADGSESGGDGAARAPLSLWRPPRSRPTASSFFFKGGLDALAQR
jgi:hypothetical protein